MSIEQIIDILKNNLHAEVVKSIDGNATPVMLQIDKQDLLAVCKVLHYHDQLFFDFLQCITGSDNGKNAASLEVIYHIGSIPFNFNLALQVILDYPEDNSLPSIPSVSSIWRTANWLERETYDLLGIYFTDHPDLRRILLPADWEGYPLRKDYKVQDYYHGIKVD